MIHKPIILLLGKNGQVGFELQKILPYHGVMYAFGREDFDLSDLSYLREVVRNICPDVVVNASAYTAVDKAESESQVAYGINAGVPELLAKELAISGGLLVHYSTDYVFDGLKSGWYTESDIPNPQSVYGKSKFAGECQIALSGCRYLIFRTSWVFGTHGGNFAKTILRLAKERECLNVVADQHGAPTSASLSADVSSQILARYWQESDRDCFPYGVYHLTAIGETNWYEYAKFVVDYARKEGVVLHLQPSAIKAITSSDYPVAAQRPGNSRLDCGKLRRTFGLTLPDWQVDMACVLKKIISDEASVKG